MGASYCFTLSPCVAITYTDFIASGTRRLTVAPTEREPPACPQNVPLPSAPVPLASCQCFWAGVSYRQAGGTVKLGATACLSASAGAPRLRAMSAEKGTSQAGAALRRAGTLPTPTASRGCEHPPSFFDSLLTSAAQTGQGPSKPVSAKRIPYSCANSRNLRAKSPQNSRLWCPATMQASVRSVSSI